MNKNFVSVIKNNGDNWLSCRKTNVNLKSVSKKGQTYVTEDESLQIELCSKKSGNGFEVYSEVKNVSNKKIVLNQVSSAFVQIEKTGKLEWYEKGKYRVHFCRNCWLGEGQWQTSSLSDLGLYQTYCEHSNNCYASFGSLGSQTTSKYYPMIMIEDVECKMTHYFEVLPLGNWYIEISQGYNENNEEVLYVFLAGGCEKNDAWNVCVNPNESYKTIKSVYGTVDGGFEEAVAELIKYKRENTLVKYKDNITPVCFNDYMNCHWAMPKADRTMKLIDAAADVGAEIFCMDAGWYITEKTSDKKESEDWGAIGDWVINNKLFQPYTLGEVIKYANSKGLTFGIWLEIEGVSKLSGGYEKFNDCLLKRNGEIIGITSDENSKGFYDFRCEKVRNKLESVFDMLYNIGVRYVKNDYNQTVGIGCDGACCLSEGLLENQRAFLNFIDKIENKYKDLIIENCASGAMREDANTLSHFYLQSLSDQEVYTCNPSVVAGTMACIQAEKIGIWSYPYPVRYNNRLDFENARKNAAEFSDGKQTVFNMVNSMLGTMYLSGRIDCADEFNKRLIQDGVNVYKSIREDIALSYPIYPNGTFKISEKGIFCAGNYVPSKNKAYIAVWQIDTKENKKSIDLSKYGNVKTVKRIYPLQNDYKVERNDNLMCVEFPFGNCAMLAEVEFEK